MKRGTLLLSLLCLTSGAAYADDLLSVYDQALHNDPQIRQADATRMAAREAKPQALAALLPQASGSANKKRAWSDGTSASQTLIGSQLLTFNASGRQVTDSSGWSLNLSENVFSWSLIQTLREASDQVAQAEATYVAAVQTLAQRVASQYFAVLAAQDSLETNEIARDDYQRQFEQAEKRFEVGLIAVTDVETARAARDSASAAVIVAKQQLANALETLRATTGMDYKQLNKPTDTIPLAAPVPAKQADWVKMAMDQNPTLLAARLQADIVRDQVQVAFGGHLPTVSLVAGRTYSKSNGVQVYPSGIDGTSASDSYGKSLGVQVTVPIFSGGATQSEVRQAQYNWIAAKNNLEYVSRSTEQQTRDAYLGVISGISQVKALRQAVQSNQIALKAIEAGYEVGTHTAVEVLDQRRLLVAAQNAYSAGLYAYLNSIVQLRLAAGDLGRPVLDEMNHWLAPSASSKPLSSSPDETP